MSMLVLAKVTCSLINHTNYLFFIYFLKSSTESMYTKYINNLYLKKYFVNLPYKAVDRAKTRFKLRSSSRYNYPGT